MSDRVFVIGAGNVGRGLSRAFRASGIVVTGLHARRAQEEATSVGDYPTTLNDANVIIIAVRDSEIDGVCGDLATLASHDPHRLAHGTVVLHTSGTVDPAGFQRLRALGFSCGTWHPLVPFATPERGAQLVRDAWVGIDGDATACAASRRLAAALGARTVNIPPGAKGVYHAAAVIASNFPVVLAGIASQLLANAGIAERSAEQVVYSLMRAAVGNLEHGAPADVLTGPVVRGDVATVQSHLHALRGDVTALSVYDALSRAATSLVARRHALVDHTHALGRREGEGRTGD
jgi:predicted short-subunit dehydrogenase-like oxidoreductase (DUF2520 family)